MKKSPSSLIFESIKRKIPPADRFVREAIEIRIGGRNDAREYIGKNFSELIEALQVDAYNLYLEPRKFAILVYAFTHNEKAQYSDHLSLL